MSKKEERDNFWISVGPESGYLGTIAEETARKNSGGISPDGERLGWKNVCDYDKQPNAPTQNSTDYCCPACNCSKADGTEQDEGDCNCPRRPEYDCRAHFDTDETAAIEAERTDALHSTDYLPIWANSSESALAPPPGIIPTPPADIGPERQNTEGRE